MELALSLGDASKPFSSAFIDKPHHQRPILPNGLGFSMGLSIKSDDDRQNSLQQLHLLPNTPVPHASDNGSSEAGSSAARVLDVNMFPAEVSSPSEEDENGGARKKLRLSKEQSAFLEESFKEHNTLHTKHKAALAKRLNLRPRQVEVWFQNRRAKTKLKQTEVECEYLKRSCDTLAEENRRLHKELHDLKALNTPNPFHHQPPATTLTICTSCHRTTPPPTPPSLHFLNPKQPPPIQDFMSVMI